MPLSPHTDHTHAHARTQTHARTHAHRHRERVLWLDAGDDVNQVGAANGLELLRIELVVLVPETGAIPHAAELIPNAGPRGPQPADKMTLPSCTGTRDHQPVA